jgi:hypothetical protein
MTEKPQNHHVSQPHFRDRRLRLCGAEKFGRIISTEKAAQKLACASTAFFLNSICDISLKRTENPIVPLLAPKIQDVPVAS